MGSAEELRASMVPGDWRLKLLDAALVEAREEGRDDNREAHLAVIRVATKHARREAFEKAAGRLVLGDDLMPENDCCRDVLRNAEDAIRALAEQPPPEGDLE